MQIRNALFVNINTNSAKRLGESCEGDLLI